MVNRNGQFFDRSRHIGRHPGLLGCRCRRTAAGFGQLLRHHVKLAGTLAKHGCHFQKMVAHDGKLSQQLPDFVIAVNRQRLAQIHRRHLAGRINGRPYRPTEFTNDHPGQRRPGNQRNSAHHQHQAVQGRDTRGHVGRKFRRNSSHHQQAQRQTQADNDHGRQCGEPQTLAQIDIVDPAEQANQGAAAQLPLIEH